MEHIHFIEELKKNEKYVWELIKDSVPLSTYPVKVHDGSERYEVLYDNNVKIKVNRDFYEIFEQKDNLKYSNY